MADSQHLRMLRRGVQAWNTWRRHNPEVHPDLREARLREADLAEVNLDKCDLRSSDLALANLGKARFQHSDLSGADLRSAHLAWADLQGATLKNAKLSGTDLCGTDFTDCDLCDEDLNHARMRSMNALVRGYSLFSNAAFPDYFSSKTKFTRANLSAAKFTGKDDSRENIGSFLDLATCEGLESATFAEPDFLKRYVSDAFAYAHSPDSPDARSEDLVRTVLEAIEYLRALYHDDDSPRELLVVIETISQELIKYLTTHPQVLYEIRPRQFEEIVAEILASFGWEVQLMPPVRYGGYAIYAISKDIESGLRTSWVIECKKYHEGNKVGVELVRALYGVKHLVGASNALLATTSFFTRGAKQIKASRYDIDLKDFQRLWTG